MAVLKSTNNEDSNINLLIKRYTLQVEYLFLKTNDNSNEEEEVDEDWYFRDAILKCLYSKDIQYPTS